MRHSILLLCLFSLSSIRSDRAPLSPEKRCPSPTDTGHKEDSSEKTGTGSQVLEDDPVTNSCNLVIDRQSPLPMPALSQTAPDRSPRPDNRPGNGGDVDMVSRATLPDVGRRERRQTLVSGRKIKLPQALKLVQEYGLTGCVARAACELSCNPTLYGRMGRPLSRFMAMVSKRNSIPGIPSSAVDFYRSAMAFGSQLKGSNCKTECKSQYSDCTRQTPSLLRMASRIDLSI